MVLVLADNLDDTGRIISQRIEYECESFEDAALWLHDHPHIQGHIVEKADFFRDVVENATAE